MDFATAVLGEEDQVMLTDLLNQMLATEGTVYCKIRNNTKKKKNLQYLTQQFLNQKKKVC